MREKNGLELSFGSIIHCSFVYSTYMRHMVRAIEIDNACIMYPILHGY